MLRYAKEVAAMMPKGHLHAYITVRASQVGIEPRDLTKVMHVLIDSVNGHETPLVSAIVEGR